MTHGTELRIGELAELAGVTTRAIRHYHRIGLLPEPARADNGYRCYQLRDAALLLRIRRLVELGLTLEEVADALADDAGRDLREILADLDADLAGQQRRIAARRDRIAAMLSADGDLSASADKQAVLADLERVAGHDEAGLQREQVVADLVEATIEPGAVPQLWSTYSRALADSELSHELLSLTARFDELAGADPDDAVVDALACEAGGLGDAVRALLPGETHALPGDPAAADRLLRAVTTGMGPAQVRCLTLMFGYWREASA